MRSATDHYRRDLKKLTEGVTGFLSQLDALMQQPSTVERGKKVALLCNSMEMINDRIRYNTLGINFRTDKKPAKAAALPRPDSKPSGSGHGVSDV